MVAKQWHSVVCRRRSRGDWQAADAA